MCRLLLFVLVPALAVAGRGVVWAELVMIALEGTTFSPDADTVTLSPRTFMLDLTPGIPLTTRMQPAFFNVRGSLLDFATFDGTLERAVTVGGSTGTLSQPVSLSISPTLDTLTISPGPTVVLDLGGLRQLEIEPLGTTVLGNAERSFSIDLLGTFRLTVAGSISGDLNHNGAVDAADYVVWRDGLGTIYTQADYDVWRTHFGQSEGTAAVTPGAVPEPSTSALLLLAAVGLRLRKAGPGRQAGL